MRRALLMAGLLVCLAAGAAGAADKCPSQPRMVRSLQAALHQAQELVAKNKPQEAAAHLAQYAQSRDDPHPQLSFMRGVLAYQAKQRDQAAEHFAAAVKADPCFQAALRNLAVVRYEQGKPAAAAKLALRAYELSKPPNHSLLYEAAVFYLSADQPKEAVPLLQKLAALPKPKKAWLSALVRAHLDLKQPRQAEAVVKRLLAGWPDDAALWQLAASLATMRQDYPAAAACLAVAYRLEPPAPEGWRRLGELYRAAGAPLVAARYYLKYLGARPLTPKEMDRLASLFRQGHDLVQARAWAAKAAKAQASAKRWARVGRLAMEQKDYQAARRAFADAAKLNSRGGRNWLMAGYAAWQGEELQQAVRDFAKAMEQAKAKSTTAKEAARGLKAVRQMIEHMKQG
ncbi:MAG: tetratricopeptide repeat protein [Desulfarculaceae bacterium]|nr:tetratricopeptide repeat protein [Desulfarculaceae bacterium]MCF8072646.1 tetratricopeptide repeat protein [Desulfarculaceae bacterium]MCF8102525.1 tetratricopeptide repeat protein [Desulfarculaceae bacterium]MCF8117972.1 tetratricopeptide repeat protein [Desulfarculaceae bacterium]